MLGWMARVSPTAEGFRAAFRRPSLALAEIAWRWTVGATAAVLSIFAVLEYLDSLPLTNGELVFLRSKQPFLVGRAIAHILRGSLNRATAAFLLASLALCALWIVAASIGRAVTVRDLLGYFAGRGPTAGNFSPGVSAKHPFRVLTRLNFLRAALALAAICGFVGSAVLAGFASPPADPHPALAFFVFLPMAGLVGFVWWALNWLLSLANVLAVRNQAGRNREEAMDAISGAVSVCRERAGAVFAVSLWTGLMHLGAFIGATTVASMFLRLAAAVPWRLAVAGITLVTLAYFVVADWLYVARLAGYVRILEMPDDLTPAPFPPVLPSTGSIAPVRITIDFEEPILSDVSNLADLTT
jgi:hypothetical protein